ncbi:MAG: hypothetical protein JSS65_00745 [Armatimonadetes bacterium]|nr:hypothetical protein [Armatimonadota bacterium]
MNRIDRTQLIWATTQGPEAPRRVMPVNRTTAAILRARDKFRNIYPTPTTPTSGQRPNNTARLDTIA